MTNFDHRIQARITGTRNGWGTTLVDTPVFELRSNAQFGGIWTQADAVQVVRHMFERLTQPGDQLHISIANLEGGDNTLHTFEF